MNWIDILFLIILGVATVYGMWTGFVMQVANLVALVLATLVAGRLNDPFGNWLVSLGGQFGQQPLLAHAVAFTLIFFLVFALVRLVAALFRGALKKLMLGKPDKLLGGIVGLLAGLAVCIAITVMLIPPEGEEPSPTAAESLFVKWAMRGIQATKVWVAENKEGRIGEFLDKVEGE